MTKEEKLKNLLKLKDNIDKEFGKGSLLLLSEKPKTNIAVINSGSIKLNKALGVGGLPRGRIIEIYGPESSGKTTLALEAISHAQKQGGVAAFIDAEHALDMQYAEKLGVDLSSLFLNQPDNGEQGLEIVEKLVSSNSVDIIVVDSVAALVPKAEIEGEMGDSRMGLHARLMSQALRKLTGLVAKSNTTVIFINQLRDKIGVMFGSPETTTGGNALKFYASVRLDIRRIKTLNEGAGTDATGNRVKVKVVKNKVSPPFKVVEFTIVYGKGIDKIGELFEIAVDTGIVHKAGAWYSYNGSKLGQGEENAKKLLLDNPELFEKIKAEALIKFTGESFAPTEDEVKENVDIEE